MKVTKFIKLHKQLVFFLIMALLIVLVAIFAKQIAPRGPLIAIMEIPLRAPD